MKVTLNGIAQEIEKAPVTGFDLASTLADDARKAVLCMKVNGKVTDRFPYTAELNDCEPIYHTLPGWKCDISGARRWEDLPKAAQDYVTFIEERVGCKIQYVSVGPERDALIIR